MDYKKKASISNLAALSLLVATVVSISVLGSSAQNRHFSFLRRNFRLQCPHINDDDSTSSARAAEDELDIALRGAAMADGKLIIMVVNKAYTSAAANVVWGPTMLDLFLESFWMGEGTRPLLDHLLVAAMDSAAYERCMFRRLHCFRLETDGVDFAGEKLFMSEDFLKMMWRRTRFLLDVLKRGYSFVFTDTDIMWLRNPFLKLGTNDTDDLQISTDRFNGDPRSQRNPINTGFYYARSNNRTIALFELWHAAKDRFVGKKEQDVLLELMHEGVFKHLNLSVRFLDTLYFSGFCQDSKDLRAVTTVHANCCRSIHAKVDDLRAVLLRWKRFCRQPSGGDGELENNGTKGQPLPVPWHLHHTECTHSWGHRATAVKNSSSISFNKTLN